MNGMKESKTKLEQEPETVNLDDLSWYLLEKLRAEFVTGKEENE